VIAALLKGLGVGLAIAAPVGPIGVLCIRRTLADGRRHGLAAGLGAATADACYGMIAAFGLRAVTGVLLAAQWWLSLAGGLFLCYLGARTALARPAEASAGSNAAASLRGAYLSTLLLTLANPATILSFVAVFAGLGLVGGAGYEAATALVAGVFLGSALWWLLLSSVTSVLGQRLDVRWLRRVNWLSAATLVGFGLYALAGLRSR
jgi:threonine/homoserine/homoserine lactone efflux protein